MIKNSRELRQKYETLLLLKNIKDEADSLGYDDCNNSINDLTKKIKKEIRDYYKEEDKRKKRLIKDNGLDGCIILFEFPSKINSFELAKEYFEAWEYKRCRPSMYDCTGDSYTAWYKIFKRHEKFFAYHYIGFDV